MFLVALPTTLLVSLAVSKVLVQDVVLVDFALSTISTSFQLHHLTLLKEFVVKGFD